MSYLHTHICTDNYLTLPIMVYLDTPTSIVAEQGLMSHQTHYRLYWEQDFMDQMTQLTASKH